MEKKSVFSKVVSWLGTTEMFARPSKQLPGMWHLYEYFIDSEKELLNIKTDQLRNNGHYLHLSMDEDNTFLLTPNLPIELFNIIDKGEWSISKNYVTFIHPNDFRKSVEFQFAFENGDLKLLKKNELGKIEFFGFFKRLKAL